MDGITKVLNKSEFRIGNKLMYQGRVTDVAWYHFDVDNPFFSKAEPIVLTEDLLLMLGGEKQALCTAFQIREFKQNFAEISLAVNDIGKNTFYVYFREGKTFGGHEDELVLLRNDLRYLHEFQNLHQSITGFDLREPSCIIEHNWKDEPGDEGVDGSNNLGCTGTTGPDDPLNEIQL